ncbi:MAG: hypothetical protein WAP51_04575 [Candidatus Sungiibacteriota bacterium]
MKKKRYKNPRAGYVMQKVLLLLAGGFALGLSGRPDAYFRILKGIAKEWEGINQRQLRESIQNLYRSHLVDYEENNDGTASLLLTNQGKQKALRFNLDNMKISRPSRWDGLWRVVIFDIPESKKKARDAFSFKIKQLGLHPLQKSVFISPFECRDEIDFVIEMFDLRPHVRFLVVKDIDIAPDLKRRFRL